MILNFNGDVLTADVDIIAHQVNCKGVMGSGVAKQIAELYPSILTDYILICNTKGQNCLGHILYSYPFENRNIIIANLFGQYSYGHEDRVYTDIKALEKCFMSLVNIKNEIPSFRRKDVVKIAIPYKIGCHRGRENWNNVYKIIENLFSDNTDAELQIWKYDEEKRR
jgi:O-acetyl-ADP-ribose deacetylase (regulator of RNase III)